MNPSPIPEARKFFPAVVHRILSVATSVCDLIYPRSCAGCEDRLTESFPFCPDCLSTFRRIVGPTCAHCGIPFVSEAATSHSPDQRCGDCREDPPKFSKVIAPFFYEGAIVKGIWKFKYEKQTKMADFFAQCLVDDLAFARGTTYRIVPIPLHPDRLRHREFNQSLLLAAKIAGALSLPYAISALIRTRPTPPQVGLSRKEREANLKGAFCVSRPDEVRGFRILLVDDVYTTGTTLKEGAKTLIKAGAEEVIAVAIARLGPLGSLSDRSSSLSDIENFHAQ